MSSGCGDVLSLQDLQVAKRNQIFEAEVITGKQGGIALGANIDYATNQNTGQVQKTMPAILRDIGFEPASFDFTSGGTLTTNDRNKAVLWPMVDGGDGDWYYWEGALPKVVPAASSPLTTGGVAEGAWRPVGDITLRGDLASGSLGEGDALLAVKAEYPNSILRNQHDKNAETVSLLDFGAKGDGVQDDSTSFSRMAADVGFIRVTSGSYLVSNITIDVPIYFEMGSCVTVPAGSTITLTNRIQAPREYIFQGDGTYAIGHDSNTGEDARQLHASWFGAFPSPSIGPDQAPFINKALAAVGNARESVLDFDIGNYNISSQILVSRGTLIRGMGTRRTVFKVDVDGFSVFKTNNVACKFEGIQFELHPTLTTRTSPYIEIAHGECSITDAYFTAPFEGVLVTGSNARISNIMAVYGVSPGAGSSLIHVAGGSNNHIDEVLLPTSQYAPEALVKVGGTAATVSGTIIEGLTYITPGSGVIIDAVGTVGRTSISRLSYNGGTATKPDSLITIRSTGSAVIETVNINDITSNSNSSAVIRIEQGSSGEMRDILISDVVAGGSTAGDTGDGIVVLKTGAGAIKGVVLSDSINVRRRLNQLTVSPAGALSDSYISPSLLRNTGVGYVYTFTVPTDTAVVIDLQRDMFIGRIDVCAGVSNYGLFTARAAATPSINNITVSANMATALTPLTGTTGAAGKLTVAPQPKQIYIENRLGSTQTVICVVNGTFS